MALRLLRSRGIVPKEQISDKGSDRYRDHHPTVVCHENKPVQTHSQHTTRTGKQNKTDNTYMIMNA